MFSGKFNLGWKIALALKGQSSPKLLESYEYERLPVIAEMLDMTTRILSRDMHAGESQTQAVESAAATMPKLGPKAEGAAWSRDRKLFQVRVRVIHYQELSINALLSLH